MPVRLGSMASQISSACLVVLTQARSAVEAQGFAGYSEIEIFSNDWWDKSMDDVLRTCIERHKSVV